MFLAPSRPFLFPARVTPSGTTQGTGRIDVAKFTGFQMVGVMRFSVLTTDFRTSRRGTPEEIAASIFSDEAMERRFRLFEALALPTLKNQTDDDFRIVILTSELMPRKYLTRLNDLAGSVKGAEIWPAPLKGHYNLLQMAFARVPEDGSGHRLSFRLDDDDAVDLELVERSKRIARRLLPEQEDRMPTILCWNKGFYLDVREGEENVLTDTHLSMPLAIGNVLIHRPGDGHNPYRYNHRNFPQQYNCWSSISEPGFIRSIHAGNSATPYREKRSGEMDEGRTARQIRRHFGLDAAALKAL